MRILIVEDEKPKFDHLLEFLKEALPGSVIENASSVRSAIAAIKSFRPELVILDMSLPTFDIQSSGGGGRPRGFGGLDILYEMEAENLICPVIVVTGYDAFAAKGKEMSLRDLNKKLSEDHPNQFVCLIHYNSLFGEWQTKLSEALAQVVKS